MQILSYEDIKALDISPEMCYEWVIELLRHKGEMTLPPKISLHQPDDSFFNVMPSLLPQMNAAGVKVITRQLGRVPALDSQILLYNLADKTPRALMDGNWITAMRTGAVAAHSIMQLAVEDFFEIGVMGLGNTGRAAMEVLLSVVGDRPLQVKVLKYKDQHEEYVAKFKGADGQRFPNVEFVAVDTVEEVIENSDVVVSAVTYQEDDFCEASLYKKGCLVVAVHLRGFMNCDLAFDRVFCDDIPHVKDFKYFSRWPNVTEMSDVVVGNQKGRLNDEERIIVYNVGLSLHDINFAQKVLSIAGAAGQHTGLTPPTEKIWV